MAAACDAALPTNRMQAAWLTRPPMYQPSADALLTIATHRSCFVDRLVSASAAALVCRCKITCCGSRSWKPLWHGTRSCATRPSRAAASAWVVLPSLNRTAPGATNQPSTPRIACCRSERYRPAGETKLSLSLRIPMPFSKQRATHCASDMGACSGVLLSALARSWSCVACCNANFVAGRGPWYGGAAAPLRR